MRDPQCVECQKTTGPCNLHAVTVTYYGQGMAPWRCPVCDGKGLVPSGFYGAVGVESWCVSDMTPDQCRTCVGTGVLWR